MTNHPSDEKYKPSAAARPRPNGEGERETGQWRRYSREELARHDGSDPNLPMLIAYNRKVYDVTASYQWAKGSHWGDHRAGQHLTGCLNRAGHGEEMLSRVPCVGAFDEELP